MADMLSSISSNVLPVILAIVMAFSGVCGGLSQAGMDKPVTAELSMEMDGDLSPIAGEAGEAIKDLVSSVSLLFAADPAAAQFGISLKDTPLVSLSAKAEEGGWAVVSNLFPSSVLTVKNETLEQMQQAVAQQLSAGGDLLSSINPQAIAEALIGSFGSVVTSFMATAGEPETGSFTVDGVEYTTKIPYSITTKEAAALVINAAKEFLSSEAVAPILSAAGQNFNPEQLDSALEDINNSDEKDVPVLSAADYSNAAGDTCFEAVMTKDEETVSFITSTSGAVSKVAISALNQADLRITVDSENRQADLDGSFAGSGEGASAVSLSGSLKGLDNGADLSLTVKAPVQGAEMNIGLDGSVRTGDGRTDLSVTFRVPFNGADISLTVKGALTEEGPVFEAAEGLKTLAMEDLMSGTEEAEAFTNEVTGSLFAIIGKLLTDYSDLFSMTGGSGSPEAAPAQ